MLETKYITLDNFQEYFNIDLRNQLGDEEKALAFLKRVEDRMEVFIDSNFNRNIDHEFPSFTDYQKEHYKLALLEQCIYIFRNGDLSTDSGYDGERGEVSNNIHLHKISFAPNAIDHLRVCGLWNREVRSNRVGIVNWFIR